MNKMMSTAENNPEITFENYEKISDILLYFDKDISLRFNVRMARKNKKGSRKYFHSEVQYVSKQYTDQPEVVNINRYIDFYFSIEDASDYKNGIMIGIEDIIFFRIMFHRNIIPWFDKGNGIFGKSPDDGQTVIMGEWQCQEIFTRNNKNVEFMPAVLDCGPGMREAGVRMCINNRNNFVDMNFQKILIFYNMITKTDMYCTACNMLVYAKTAPYGINRYRIE